MSDEISLNKSWTIEAYVAHNESMRMEMDRRYEQRFDAQERAVLKAEAASEKRFDSVNEVRETLADQAKHLISRNEVEQQFKSINEKVDTTTGRMDRLEGRAGGSTATWTYAVAAIGVVGTIVGIIGTVVAVIVITRGP